MFYLKLSCWHWQSPWNSQHLSKKWVMIPFGYRHLKIRNRGHCKGLQSRKQRIENLPREHETCYNCCTYLRLGIINELLMSDASDTSWKSSAHEDCNSVLLVKSDILHVFHFPSHNFLFFFFFSISDSQNQICAPEGGRERHKRWQVYLNHI